MTSAFSANFRKIAFPSSVLRLRVRLRLLRCRFWKSNPSRREPVTSPRLARLLDLDHIGAPIGELANRRRPGAGMTQIEDGKFRQRQSSNAHDGVFLV